ncbi:hypothetical protein BN1708_007158, partial [Verticillium longisporum]
MVIITVPPPGDDIVDVLPESNAVENSTETLPGNRQLTVSLPSLDHDHGYSRPGSITVAHGNTKDALTLTLNRTIRVPDNQDINALPPSCGQFPLYRVRDYARNLPDNMVQRGGLFFPMYQREAMWIAFHANHPFAIKIYVGGVNAVSGFPMTENDKTRQKRARMLRASKQIQDYMVVPGQPWLDGIVSEDGKIRQFVAQPKGSGFAVEAQVTGEEKVGGIQIEIIPVKRNTPTQFDVRYEDREQRVVTRTFKLADRGITAESTWEDVKKVIRDEFDIALGDQVLSDHNDSAASAVGSRHASISFDNDVKLGDVYFPPNFSTLSVKNRPPPARRDFPVARTVPFQSFSAAPGVAHAFMADMQYDLSENLSFGAAEGSTMVSGGGPPPPPPPAPMSGLRSVRHGPDQPKPTPQPKAAVKEMGIAAGGLITQTINPDAYPADSWDSSASIMLNLQILDVASYSAVTGLPAPSTPVNGEDVAQMEKERALAEGRDVPPEEKSVPVRIVKIGGQPRCFKTTFRPLEVLTKELEGLAIGPHDDSDL